MFDQNTLNVLMLKNVRKIKISVIFFVTNLLFKYFFWQKKKDTLLLMNEDCDVIVTPFRYSASHLIESSTAYCNQMQLVPLHTWKVHKKCQFIESFGWCYHYYVGLKQWCPIGFPR